MLGFTFQGSSFTAGVRTDSPTLKLLAYADDVCLLLRDQNDFSRAQHHMLQYTSVSNTKFNIDKTEAFSLNVLNSTIQHHILQKRWPNYIFNSNHYPSFVHQLALNHVSLFLNSSLCSLLPFYFPEYRKSRVCDNNLPIWHAIFDVYDAIHTDSTIEFPELPLDTLLALPLHKLIIPLDSNHWTLKHKTFLSGQFFVYDIVQKRLHLRITGEYTRYPRLRQQLYSDILQTRIVKLQSNVWPYILEELPSPVDWSDHSMVTNIISSTAWKYYSPRYLRQIIQSSSPITLKYPSSVVKVLWSCSMYPNARTLYFRCLSNCIPTKKILLRYGIVSSSDCSLCGKGTDSRRHFLVECEIKWKIWKQVLKQYFPTTSFTSEDIYKSIRYLKVPPSIPKAKQYFSVLSTTLYQLWIIYWQHGNDNPYPYPLSQIETSLQRIVSHIERLLPSKND
ncbi:hypothetical protein G6F57_009568 [Rhizopus arrhizus]|uniref:Reverse transcriptase zinc-binding domain-containing protein n=1 Tax=Rhizopus oryzae TaxID=64495 RepID=A0A9P7BNW3_RHIOR|nr:hypothetical protein G6F23_003002 [Rhizopus arrhizus]KAG1412075.1 hypothetical protein G6F58_008212 [Rhizopus delemar]KAG0933675.1 hypothetical protein G6F30_010164 [Rhizopus arrhizus]KAG0977051.1 hypothetical protein G6F29_010359 [Rhizopus arrhizus]KAG0987714.1 hypothetical protein G6F28_009951 [Rhizopus arrhizus]